MASVIQHDAPAAEQPVGFDPFELEDTVAGSAVDPFPILRDLRRKCPVQVGPIDLGDGSEPPALDGRPLPVSVLGFDEAMEVLRDGKTYSSSVYEGVIGAVMGRTILQMDDPEHRLHRALVSPTFRSRMLEKWEDGLIRQVVNELVDRFAGRGHADLVRELTFDFPVQVIARILGLPRRDYPKFQRWAVEIISTVTNWERGIAASEALREYFAEVLADRRRHPADDLISELAQAEVDGARLEDEEIHSFLRLLLPAGVETTYRESGNLLFALLTHPDQLAAVQADRSLLGQAMEESLRWEPPVCIVLRRATRAAELAGVPVGEGADIALLLSAANRDERKFERPDEYDLFRTERQHVGFGFGIHVCLGMHLARLETRVALNVLFDRLRELRLDPAAGQEVVIKGTAFRSPTALPVAFTPEA